MPNSRVYKNVGSLMPGRSAFDLSYTKTFTCDMGQLIPVMCDEVGFLTVAGLRVLDWYLPKNWHSRWASRHGEKDEQNND